VTPATLSGSASPGTVAGAGSGERNASAGRSPEAGGFERMLKQRDASAGTRRAEATATPAGSQQAASTAGDKRRTAGGERDSHAVDVPVEATPGEAAAQPATDEAPTTNEEDVAAWPPMGLAGLMLVSAPLMTRDAGMPAAMGDAAATPALPAAADASAMQAPAMAASGAAIAGEAAVSTDSAADEIAVEDLDALQVAAKADGPLQDDAAPATPASLHGIGASHAVRAGADVAALRGMEPTPTPVLGQEGFDDALSARIGWLADQKIGHAHIRISPDDLGSIDVRLQLDGDKVNASFSSPHVDVRQALESSLPRLRELLGEQGFQLAHADVGQQAHGGSGEPRGDDASHAHVTGDGDAGGAEVTLSAAQLIRQRGILDAYA